MSNVSLVENVRGAKEKPDPDGYLWASTKTVILGDFYEDPTIFGLGVRAGVGCIPVVGQLMDLSDTAAWVVLAYERGIDDEEVMLNGAILFIGYVPGVGDVLRNLLKALVSNRAMKGMAQLLEKLANTISKNQYKALKEAVFSKWDDHVGTAISTCKEYLTKFDELLKELKEYIPDKLTGPIDDFIAFIAELQGSVDAGFRKALAKPREQLEKLFAEVDKVPTSAAAKGSAKRVDDVGPTIKSEGIMVDRYLGEGSFSRGYRDGDEVVKVVKDRIGKDGAEQWDLTNSERHHLAELTVEFQNDLATADGFSTIVPKISVNAPGEMRVPFANGKEYDELAGEARILAIDQARDAHSRANKFFGLEGSGELEDGWKIMVDDALANYRFDDNGKITSWFDPIGVYPPVSHPGIRTLDTSIPLKDPDYRTPTLKAGPVHPKGADAPIDPKCEKDPIDVVSGAMLAEETDFSLPGPLPFEFSRSWSSSHANRVGSLGRGWMHSFDQSLTIEADSISVLVKGGRTLSFAPLDYVGGSSYNRGAKSTLLRVDRGYVLYDDLGHRFAFGDVGRGGQLMLAGIKDRNSNGIALRYDEAGLLVEAIDSAGRKIEFKNNEFGYLTEVFVPHPDSSQGGELRLRIVSYEYDEEPHLVGVTDALKQTSKYEYDVNHLLTKAIDRNGVSFYWEYDTSGLWPRCSKTWGDDDVLYGEFSYDRPHRVTTITDKAGNQTVYHGGVCGMPVKMVDALNGVTRYSYDEDGNLLSETGPLGATTLYEYDRLGRLVCETNALGYSQKTEYDKQGLIIAKIDALGQRWERSYDALGNMLSAYTPGATYDSRGLVTGTTDLAGRQTLWQWDASGNLLNREDDAGKTTRYQHDALGQLIAETDSEGVEANYGWDLLGREISNDYDGSTWRFEYDGEGNCVSTEDPFGATTAVAYSAGGIAGVITSKTGLLTQRRFDSELNLTSVEDAEGRVWGVELDSLGNTISETTFDGVKTCYKRDAVGRLLEKITALGQQTVFEYDALGQLIAKSFTDGTKSRFEYDALGRLVFAGNDVSQTAFKYDRFNNIIEESNNSLVTQYDFDMSGNCVLRKSPWHEAIEFSYTKDNLLQSITMSHGSIRLEYDASGREVGRVLPSGVRLSREYLAGETTHRTIGPQDERLSERTYTYGAAGQIVSIAEPLTGGSRYQYDEEGRLQASSYSDQVVEHYAQDTVGNMQGVQRDGADLAELSCMSTMSSWQIEWDGNGSITRKEKDNAAFEYAYDAAAQLASVRKLVRIDGKEITEVFVTFEYDALGRRVHKKVRRPDSVESTVFHWDGNVLLGEQKPNGPIVEYVFAAKSFDPMIAFDNESAMFMDCDHRSVPYGAVDLQGQKIWSAGYRAYGTVIEEQGAIGTIPFRFAGQYADIETGLYYNRFRYYDPELRIYGASDPLGLDGGLASYAYPSDPLLLTDPFGLQCKGAKAKKKKKASSNQPNVDTSPAANGNVQNNSVSGESFATPGQGRSGATNSRHGIDTSTASIDPELKKELQKKVGRADSKKFDAALKKGIVGPTNQSGIKKLKPAWKGYSHELKISGSAQRLMGKSDDSGAIVFDHFEKGGLH